MKREGPLGELVDVRGELAQSALDNEAGVYHLQASGAMLWGLGRARRDGLQGFEGFTDFREEFIEKDSEMNGDLPIIFFWGEF